MGDYMETEVVLDNLQENCNKLYEEFGASEDVMKLQIAINSLRHTLNISDKTKMTSSNEGFVQ